MKMNFKVEKSEVDRNYQNDYRLKKLIYQLNFIQKKSFLYMVISCFLYIAFISSANVASRFLEVGMIGLIPLVCAQKFSWDKKWLFVYGLIGYIICYQTTLISISILIGM